MHTGGWRWGTLRRPEYRADRDLVAVAPNGRLTAFCTCWLDLDEENVSAADLAPISEETMAAVRAVYDRHIRERVHHYW
jgi:hypothetical protein